jgi:hypothetical protein
MTPRSIRRAAERKAKKLAKKQERALAIEVPDEAAAPLTAPAAEPISPAQLAANRANAQLSTGPRTVRGKSQSCLNAIKTGLTGRTVLLPTDDAAHYERHVRSYFNRFKPQEDRECELVQCMADTLWRILRIPSLESGIYALGRLECKDMFQDEEPSIRAVLVEAHVYRTCQKQINNLYLQESRLHRQFEKYSTELTNLLNLRAARERVRAASAPQSAPRSLAKSADFSKNGFEFSTLGSEHVGPRIEPEKEQSRVA